MTKWQAELKRNKELKIAEAVKNPKSKLLRSGRKTSGDNTSIKTQIANKESLKSIKSNSSKPKPKNTGMRFEDAVKSSKVIESVRKNKNSFKNSNPNRRK